MCVSGESCVHDFLAVCAECGKASTDRPRHRPLVVFLSARNESSHPRTTLAQLGTKWPLKRRLHGGLKVDSISSRESCRLLLCMSAATSRSEPVSLVWPAVVTREPNRRRSQTACQLEHSLDSPRSDYLAGKPGRTEPRENCARAACGVVNRPGPEPRLLVRHTAGIPNHRESKRIIIIIIIILFE